ncbi:MAG TPA: C_GCAxxG_C_C family protein [Firmicutes bacterium]|nr:C_GCAxxG_C_C family protein [Bacillota bacterium]
MCDCCCGHKTDSQERAIWFFRQGYNCAESVLLALSEAWDLKNELIPAVATGFGGGMGSTGATCGAATGALMAIGLRGNRQLPDDLETKDKVSGQCKQFLHRFLNECEHLNCRDLTGVDMGNSEDRARFLAEGMREKCCEPLLQAAVRFASEIVA